MTFGDDGGEDAYSGLPFVSFAGLGDLGAFDDEPRANRLLPKRDDVAGCCFVDAVVGAREERDEAMDGVERESVDDGGERVRERGVVPVKPGGAA